MSKSRRLDPLTAAQLKRQARCPDCSSSVRIVHDGYGPGAHRLEVRHDDTCPTLAGLRKAGRTTGQIVLAQAPGQSTEEFARTAMDAAAALSQHSGRRVEIRGQPYAVDPLGVADGSTFRTTPRGSRGTGRGRGH